MRRLGGDATAAAGGGISVEELQLQLHRANEMIKVLQESKQAVPTGQSKQAVPTEQSKPAVTKVAVDSVSWLLSNSFVSRYKGEFCPS